MSHNVKLYELLSKQEILKVKNTDIRNCMYRDITIGEMIHMQHCMDNLPYMTLKDVLDELIKRAAKYDKEVNHE